MNDFRTSHTEPLPETKAEKKPRPVDPKVARAQEQARHARNSLRLVKAQAAEGIITKGIGRLENRLADLEKKQQEAADHLSKINGHIVKVKADMEAADKRLVETKAIIAELQA